MAPTPESGPGRGSSREPARPPGRRGARYAFWGLVAVWVAATLWMSAVEACKAIPLSRFLELAQRGRVAGATIAQGEVEGTYRTGTATTPFRTVLPPDYETSGLVDLLRAEGAEVSATQPSP